MPEIRLYTKKQKIPKDIFSIDLSKYPDLDPKNIGPCMLYKGRTSSNFYNSWEYSKVYKEHTENGQPCSKYWEWAQKGWSSNKPAKTTKKKYLYHLWDGAKYGIIEARKKIFISRYIKIMPQYAFDSLKADMSNHKIVALISDFGLDHKKYTLTETLFNPDKEFGYPFVLAMILNRDISLTDIP